MLLMRKNQILKKASDIKSEVCITLLDDRKIKGRVDKVKLNHIVFWNRRLKVFISIKKKNIKTIEEMN